VTTGLGTTITGGNRGIYARNLGSGSLNVTTNGDVTGTGATSAGIDARNYGTDLSVTTDLGTTVVGRNYGIRARNLGSGALTVTANGDVTGTNNAGIYAYNLGTSLSITSERVTGDTGIFAHNYGTGALRITANGDVVGTGVDGIYAENTIGNPIDITVSSGATVAGNFAGVGIGRGGANSLTNRGTIANLNGGNSVAIFGRTGNETVNNFGTVTGNVDLGTGTNAFNNLSGGLFNSGTLVDLGGGNLLNNSGALSPGGTGTC
jgi:hypothetical protein